MVEPKSQAGAKPPKTHHSRGILLGGQSLHPEKARLAFMDALRDQGFVVAEPGAAGSTAISLHIGGRGGFFAHFSDPDRHAHALGMAVSQGLHAPLSILELELRGSAPHEPTFGGQFSLTSFSVAADGTVSMGAPPAVPPSLLHPSNAAPFSSPPDEAAYQERLADAEGVVSQEILSSLLPERDLEVLGVVPPTLTTPLKLRELADAKVAASNWAVGGRPRRNEDAAAERRRTAHAASPSSRPRRRRS
jgi:hypothetical protein